MKQSLPYTPTGNAVVERGHLSMNKALAKACKVSEKTLVDMLRLVVLADRTTVRSFTRFLPHYLVFGFELNLPSGATQRWKAVALTEDLMPAKDMLEMRVEQIGLLKTLRENAVAQLKRRCKEQQDQVNKD